MKSLDELQDFKVTKADKKLVEHVTTVSTTSNKKKRSNEKEATSSSSSSSEPTKKKRKKSDDKKIRAPRAPGTSGKQYTLSSEMASFAGCTTDTRFQVLLFIFTF